jgi:hypothetical protein
MDQRTRAFYESAYPRILWISVPVHSMNQRTRVFYGSAYPCILRISVPVYFTDQRTRALYYFTERSGPLPIIYFIIMLTVILSAKLYDTHSVIIPNHIPRENRAA